MKYLTRLKKKLDVHRYSGPGEWSVVQIKSMWPDTSPASDGNHPISPDGLQRLISQSPLIRDEAHFIKHILTTHDGEARIIIDDGYAPLPAKTLGARQWLYYHRWLDNDEGPRCDRDIRRILAQEQNRTLLLRWHPHPPPNPASGGYQPLEAGDWETSASGGFH